MNFDGLFICSAEIIDLVARFLLCYKSNDSRAADQSCGFAYTIYLMLCLLGILYLRILLLNSPGLVFEF